MSLFTANCVKRDKQNTFRKPKLKKKKELALPKPHIHHTSSTVIFSAMNEENITHSQPELVFVVSRRDLGIKYYLPLSSSATSLSMYTAICAAMHSWLLMASYSYFSGSIASNGQRRQRSWPRHPYYMRRSNSCVHSCHRYDPYSDHRYY